MGYIKKLKNNELVGGTDKHTIYPVTSTKAVFEEVTDSDKSSFKSQETINGEHDDRIKGLEEEMPDTVKSITINGGTKKYTVDDEGNVALTVYTVDGDPEMPAIAEAVQNNTENIETLQNTIGGLDAELSSEDSHVSVSVNQSSGLINGLNVITDDIASAADLAALTSGIEGLRGPNVVITPNHLNVSNPQENTIYREQGENTTYKDWSYANGTWYPMATYDIGNLGPQVSYYTCTTQASTPAKAATGTDASAYALTLGGHFKVEMDEANTATSGVTLQVGSATAKELMYNGAAVTAENTWEAGEVIAVYYYNNKYWASNAQGGGGKAEKIKYDNSQKRLLSENVQDALDEVGDNLTSTNDLEVSLSYGSSYNVAIVQGVWRLNTSSTSQACNIIPVKEGEEYHVVARTSDSYAGSYAWLTSDSHVNGQTPAFLSGYGSVITFDAGTEFNIIVPEGATYLYFGRIVQGNARLPKEVRLLHKTKDVTEGNTSYLIDGMKMLSVGQAYEIGDAVRTTDMRLLRMTKQVKEVSSKDTISVGELKSWPGQRKTLVGLQAVEPYDSTHTYSSGDYALGNPNGDTVICKYSNGSWASATFANMVSDGILEEVDIDYIIENATEKNDVTHDIENHAGWVSEELFDVSDPLQMPYVYNSSFMSAAKTETGVVWTVTAKSNSVNYAYLTLPNMHYGSRIVISFDYKDEFAVTSIARADMLPFITNSTGTYPTAGKAIGNIRPDCNHADFEFIYDNENIKYLFFQFDGGFATSVNKVLELSNISIKEYRLVKDETLKDSEAVTYEVGDELNLTHYLARYGLLGSDLRWDYTLTQRHIIIPIGNASVFTITGGVNNGSYAFLSDYKFGYRQQALFAKSETRRTVSAGETQRVSVPAGAKWLMVNIVSGAGNDLKPASIVVSNIDGNYTPYKESRLDDIEETAAATKAILGNYEAADTYMNLQIVKAGRESAASCYWWYPHIICTRFPYKRIYHTFCDGNGCAGVACINAFDKRAWKCLLKRMTFDGVDLHNTAMIDRLPDGRLICAYSEGHNQTTYMHIRISKRADDITEWNDAISINAGSDITYCQYHYVNGTHVIFSRIEHGGSWGYTKSTDLVNWSSYHKLIDEDVLEGENKYYYVWTKPIAGDPNKLRFIGYSHPSHSPQYTFIICGILDFENNRVCDYDGTVLSNYDGTVQQGTLDDMFYNTQFTTLVPNNNNLDGFGTTYAQRMYDLAITDINTVKILFGRQKNQTDGRYWVYENINGVESTTMLCHSGLTFLNHSNTRAANGLCFLDEDNIIVSRSDEQVNPAGYDYIEKYSKVEGVWTKTKDVYKEEIGSEILRNAYPIASPDGKYVMWMRGHVDLDGFMNAKVDLVIYDVDNDTMF